MSNWRLAAWGVVTVLWLAFTIQVYVGLMMRRSGGDADELPYHVAILTGLVLLYAFICWLFFRRR